MRFFFCPWLIFPVGFDWGERWGKLVSLQRSGQRFVLRHAIRFCWQDGRQSSQLRELWAYLRLRKKILFLATAGRLSLSSSAAAFGLEQNSFGFETESSQRDFIENNDELHAATVWQDQNGISRQIRICASKEQIVKIQRQIHQAGLQVQVVDNKAVALCNLYSFSYPEQLSAPVYLLHFGKRYSQLIFYKSASPVWNKDLEVDSDQISAYFTEQNDEEKNKLIFNAENTSLYANLDGKSDFEQKIEKIKILLKNKEQAKKVYVSGGSLLIPGFLDFLQEKLPLPVELLHCWRKIEIDENCFDKSYLQEVMPQFSVACAMALRAAIRCGT